MGEVKHFFNYIVGKVSADQSPSNVCNPHTTIGQGHLDFAGNSSRLLLMLDLPWWDLKYKLLGKTCVGVESLKDRAVTFDTELGKFTLVLIKTTYVYSIPLKKEQIEFSQMVCTPIIPFVFCDVDELDLDPAYATIIKTSSLDIELMYLKSITKDKFTYIDYTLENLATVDLGKYTE